MMTTGEAILFLVSFAMFVVLMLAAIVWIGHMGRKAMPHHPHVPPEEEDPDAERD